MKHKFIYFIFIFIALVYSGNSCLSGSANNIEKPRAKIVVDSTNTDSNKIFHSFNDISSPTPTKTVLSEKEIMTKQFDNIQLELKQQHHKIDSLLDNL